MFLATFIGLELFTVTGKHARGLNIFLQLPRIAARGLIGAYRLTISPLLGPRCRHLPGCAEYAETAIGRFGLWAGGWMALARILRCQPWGTSGLDYVPPKVPANAHWYLPWRYARWRGVNDTVG